MIEKLTESDLMFCELFFNPKCLIECTYTLNQLDWYNSENKCIKVRLYQVPMLTYDCVLEDDINLTEQQNFKKRINAGTLLLVSARKIGKTFIALVGNILKALVYYNGLEMTMASYDEIHVEKVMNEARDFFTNHPFYKMYKKSIRGSPNYIIETLNGNNLSGINENIKGSDPGKNWYGYHSALNFQDEIQAETERAYHKKIDAIGESGCLEVLCGIPLITKTSPMGKWLKDRSKKKTICRVPQYISPFFNSETKAERIKNYGGEGSVGFRVNVEAEDIEGAQGAFDIDRVRENYTKRSIKKFEINKQIFVDYKRLLILEPIRNSEKIFIFADVGDTAATEIGIIAKVNGKYKLIYNITTYRLAVKELTELLTWIFEKVKADYISVDCTIMGKPVFEGLSDNLNVRIPASKGIEEKYIQKVYWCAFNENIVTGFSKDEKGYAKIDGQGNPVKEYENTLVFSVQRLREMFFEKQFDIPEDDFKFDDQASGYIQLIIGNNIKFGSSTDDHYIQAFEVFAILSWLTEQLPNLSKEYSNPTSISMGTFGLSK